MEKYHLKKETLKQKLDDKIDKEFSDFIENLKKYA